MKKRFFTAIMMAILALSFTSQADEPTAATGQAKKHLFILSGQSNMALMKSDTFHATVEKAFGKDNVYITKNAKKGAPIRNWDKGYKWPEDKATPQGRKRPGRELRTREEFLANFGILYESLIEGIKKKTEGKTYDTVTFCWMQGESDAGGELVDQYYESFNRILARLKSDLKITSLNIVIGRLSDFGMDKPEWVKLRELQVTYAEETPNCEWINTDDLNDMEKKGKKFNGLHYTKEGYDILGKRFAEKAIALIQKTSTPTKE